FRIGLLQLEEALVILHGFGAAARRRRVLVHLDLAFAEIADGRLPAGRALCRRELRPTRAEDQCCRNAAQAQRTHRGGSGVGAGGCGGGGGVPSAGGALDSSVGSPVESSAASSGAPSPFCPGPGGFLRLAPALAARSYMVASANRACTS